MLANAAQLRRRACLGRLRAPLRASQLPGLRVCCQRLRRSARVALRPARVRAATQAAADELAARCLNDKTCAKGCRVDDWTVAQELRGHTTTYEMLGIALYVS